MNRIIKLLMAISAFASISYAAHRENRLVLRVEPLPTNPKQIRSVLTVKSNGSVNLRTCVLQVPIRPCTERVVTQIDARRMDEIERLIRAAEFGKIAQNTGPICAALPIKHVAYRADQGRILLQEGNAPCANARYNQTPAAKRLVQILDQLSKLAGH